jgi:hypothetical protein
VREFRYYNLYLKSRDIKKKVALEKKCFHLWIQRKLMLDTESISSFKKCNIDEALHKFDKKLFTHLYKIL